MYINPKEFPQWFESVWRPMFDCGPDTRLTKKGCYELVRELVNRGVIPGRPI